MGDDDIIDLKKRLGISFSVWSKLFYLIEDTVREFVSIQLRIYVRDFSSFLLFFKLLSICMKPLKHFIEIIEVDGHSSGLGVATISQEEIISSF